jgi:hypothetical protein
LTPERAGHRGQVIRVANAHIEGKFSQESRDAHGGYAHYLSGQNAPGVLSVMPDNVSHAKIPSSRMSQAQLDFSE